jgi:hypothetical protein
MLRYFENFKMPKRLGEKAIFQVVFCKYLIDDGRLIHWSIFLKGITERQQCLV